MLKATVSGSFHRHMPAIYSAVGELRAAGAAVLSPADPRVVDSAGEFLFVASDRLRSIKLVQDRHLEAIRRSDFLWVVCPDGYTGPSTSGEILAASVLKVPVFSESRALDVTIGQYVRQVPSIKSLVAQLPDPARPAPGSDHVLLDPDYAIARSISALESLAPALTGRLADGQRGAELSLAQTRALLSATFGFKSSP